MRPFTQVNVFSADPLGGNPVAVVHDAEGLTDQEMQRFAHWTNLSETTFLLPPTAPEADYRVRIFTPAEELPFAGHPTLGSAHAWLAGGGVPREEGAVVQECGAGLVRLRRGERLAFAAPPLVREGPVAPADVERICRGLRVGRDEVVDIAWADNGPGWIGVLLADADAVLALRPSWPDLVGFEVGVVGAYADEAAARVGAAVEVRAFCPSLGVVEDPVTGSLNASLAQWLIGSGRLPSSYVASQGTALGRNGRVFVDQDGGEIWVGGDTVTVVSGTVEVGARA
ncbi:MAG: PhzF family phenazine biosynthesis protein [Nocardioides sp.]|uniref:PhzF family phenazine biosynthesis protein n=1 Tax=Nocardioides sp. TaxID=35761 RepID=UPI0039E4D3AA